MSAAGFWSGRRVLVTGHMGFKGVWLTALLDRLGAETVGYGRDDRTPLLFRDIDGNGRASVEGDIRDTAGLAAVLRESRAEIVFHLAAQPVVRESYRDPVETFSSNVVGTASVLEAIRSAPSVAAVVCATSDKVYDNREWHWAYRETDALGGRDPYSASKAAAELVVASMAASFFGAGKHPARIATARSGNVIGGGDWCRDRIVPDAARAFAAGATLMLRNPEATRPWQHVLDPLWGYMELARSLHRGEATLHAAWNFGPDPVFAPVRDVVARLATAWGGDCRWAVEAQTGPQPHEAGLLAVDSTRARRDLGWRPAWDFDTAVARTAGWYRDFCTGAKPAGALVAADIDAFLTAHGLAGASGHGLRSPERPNSVGSAATEVR